MVTLKKITKNKGRPPGRLNRNTVLRDRAEAAAGTAVATVVTKVLPVNGKVRASAQAGITPKDLLLSSMRTAWTAAHALNIEAMAVQAKANAIPPNQDELVEAERKTLQDKATLLRHAMNHQLDESTRLAAAVAPYEHAKLANIEQRHVGNVIVEFTKY